MTKQLERCIYSDEQTQRGFHVSLVERDDDFKLLIKRVRNGQIIGGPIYYESLSKNKSFKGFFIFVITAIEENIQQAENMEFWRFGEHVLKHIIQRRE